MTTSIYKTCRQFIRDNCEKEFDRAIYAQCSANVLDEELAGNIVFDETLLARCFDWSTTAERRKFGKEIYDKWWTF